jgi:hypothetical protein
MSVGEEAQAVFFSVNIFFNSCAAVLRTVHNIVLAICMHAACPQTKQQLKALKAKQVSSD